MLPVCKPCFIIRKNNCIFKTAGILQDSNNVETTVKLRNPRKSLILIFEIISLLKTHIYH